MILFHAKPIDKPIEYQFVCMVRYMDKLAPFVLSGSRTRINESLISCTIIIIILHIYMEKINMKQTGT